MIYKAFLSFGKSFHDTRKVFFSSIQNPLKVLCFLGFQAFVKGDLSPFSLAFRSINSYIFSLKSSTRSLKLRGRHAFCYSLFATLFASPFALSYPKWVQVFSVTPIMGMAHLKKKSQTCTLIIAQV